MSDGSDPGLFFNEPQRVLHLKKFEEKEEEEEQKPKIVLYKYTFIKSVIFTRVCQILKHRKANV